jgi:thiamine pyrophosphokinase
LVPTKQQNWDFNGIISCLKCGQVMGNSHNSMDFMIVQSSDPVTLLGGGEATAGDLSEALSIAPILVAADSGADTALKYGHVPNAVIGELDSVSKATQTTLPNKDIHLIADQDSTDFDKALRSIDAPLVVGVGLLGARLDHTLAVLNTLITRPSPTCLLLGAMDVVFALPESCVLDLTPGTRVSLFPLRPVHGRSTGLKWPLDGLSFEPGGQIGTSNEATGPVQIRMEGAGTIMLLPRACLPLAIDALTRS